MRDVGQRFRALTRLPSHIRDVARAARTFRDWPGLTACHAFGRPRDSLKFADGSPLHLTRCPVDAQTAWAVFVKRDYDPLPRGGVVVDVGANYGAFAVRAARAGNRVVAVEPNSECFEALMRNARGHALGYPIEPVRAAVWNVSGKTVQIPTDPHPGNSVLRTDGATEAVRTITLDELVSGPVDYLKLDCEGAEYTIARSVRADTWAHIATGAVEYHDGVQDLVKILRGAGFRIVLHRRTAIWGMDYGFIRAERRP
jgi:FkbM family methyltransferase